MKFRSLYGVARLYAGPTDRWFEVQPGLLRFHFSAPEVAGTFVVYCLRKKLRVTLRDETKQNEEQRLDALRERAQSARDPSLMARSTPETRTYPMRVELAGLYSEDAHDFLRRYRATFHSDVVDFRSIKSRRTKAYVDLRMALEALLKAVICLRSPYGLAGRPLVDRVRGFSHRIERLMDEALKGVRVDAISAAAIAKCSIAPVDLRYQFDAMNFRSPDDRPYYDTIGSNAWLSIIEAFVEAGIRRLQAALNRRSKIVSGHVVAQELSRPSDFPQ